MPTLNEIRHKPNFAPQASKLATATGIEFEEALEVMNICINFDVAMHYMTHSEIEDQDLRYQVALDEVLREMKDD
jgi:hypothetical protein